MGLIIIISVYMCDLEIQEISKWTVCCWTLIHERDVHEFISVRKYRMLKKTARN